VALIAIGATMVGSITFSKKEGDYVKKGDEVYDSYVDAFYLLVLFS
jgi:phosphatidylserine decarboxylase